MQVSLSQRQCESKDTRLANVLWIVYKHLLLCLLLYLACGVSRGRNRSLLSEEVKVIDKDLSNHKIEKFYVLFKELKIRMKYFRVPS